MGIGPRISFSGEASPPVGNPIPSRFKIIESYSRGDRHIALRINYPDAQNYEGNKVLVYRDEDINLIFNAKNLDPHFADNGVLSPFARFAPTEDGWLAAKNLVDITSEID